MKQNWHTLLNAPNVLEPVTVEVPPEDSACLFFPPSGQPFADVDIDYFAGQLETVLESESLETPRRHLLGRRGCRPPTTLAADSKIYCP
jgi:hypothetical protein